MRALVTILALAFAAPSFAQSVPKVPNRNDAINPFYTGRFSYNFPNWDNALRSAALMPPSGNPGFTGFGVYSGLTLSFNVNFDKFQPIGYGSSGSPANAASYFVNPVFWRGTASGEGGVLLTMKWGTTPASFPAGRSFAVGMTSAASGAVDRNLDPSTQLLSGYYFGVDAGQANMWACSCGGAACTCSDTGISTPGQLRYFYATIDVAPAGGPVTWEITDQISGATAKGEFSGANQPAGTDLMRFEWYASNRGLGGGVQIYYGNFSYTWDN